VSDEPADHGELGRLAEALGVQTWYRDTQGRRNDATAEALLAVLRSMGAPAEHPERLDELRRHVELSRVRPVEPVVVAREGQPLELQVCTPTVGGAARAVVRVDAPVGGPTHVELDLGEWPEVERRSADGRPYSVHHVRLDGVTPPVGYHRLSVELGGGLHPGTLVVAPARVPGPAATERTWGVFAALHAIPPDDGSGPDVGDLVRVGRWVEGLGGRVVATLPMLATYLSQPFDPSPYAPVSQRYWNELYLDVASTPELAASEAARALLDGPEAQRAIEEQRRSRRFDAADRYRALRPVLDALAATCASGPRSVRAPFDAWVAGHPDATRYARFRAATDRTGTGWHAWGLGPGRLPDVDLSGPEATTHLWAQWTMARQLAGAATQLEAADVRLYLDLPVGTNGDGYDTWSDHDLYGWGCGVGAPPDDFFAAGQSWGFPPVAPAAARAQGHQQLAGALHHHLSAAGVLRLDHVMGFHRLFWVPDGMDPSHGVYVRYPAEEMFAVLAVEAVRRGARVVGEDLGTVPEEVRHEMDRYGLLGMYVSQFQLPAGPGQPLPLPDARQVASLDTHDTPTFAAWWRAEDIGLRRQLGFLDEDEEHRDRTQRAADRAHVEDALRSAGVLQGDADERAALGGLLEVLGASEASTVLVAADDLVLDTEPQNVPGTGADRPNWVRMLPCDLPELISDPEVDALLRRLQGSRLGAHARAEEEDR
jgi:4-alpha-glucanotransferase